ncbi:MAG: hypothetical protein ACYDG5_03440 [Dehalococcoidales bacterium]
MARKVDLTVNSNPIKLDSFVEGYVYHVAAGILNSLKGTKPIKTLDLDIDSDGLLTIDLNGEGVSVNVFVMEIVRHTLAGMISNLKGVDKEMSTLSLRVKQ